MLRTEECCQIATRGGGKIADQAGSGGTDQAGSGESARVAPAWPALPAAHDRRRSGILR